ncbi:hypothetical protein [Clostridium botulinum]|uniref:hypothetical protein n=1 Tax=Clostridium botulinum TaxID=1491 RepID=UPI0024927DCD|nr:hypothetical protein [Clostridium botulinum]BDB02993.1 hypothetical protein CBOS2020_30670 [Clostridium botulinum]
MKKELGKRQYHRVSAKETRGFCGCTCSCGINIFTNASNAAPGWMAASLIEAS